MKLSVPGTGERTKANGSPGNKGLLKLIVIAIIIIALVCASYLIYKHFQKDDLAKEGLSSVQDYEKATSSATNASLKTKNYNDYINKQVVLTLEYESQKDYKNADRVMDELFTNVPVSNITSTAYETMAGLKQAEGDKEGYIKYLKLLIKQLNTEGKPQEAAGKQKLLDSTK